MVTLVVGTCAVVRGGRADALPGEPVVRRVRGSRRVVCDRGFDGRAQVRQQEWFGVLRECADAARDQRLVLAELGWSKWSKAMLNGPVTGDVTQCVVRCCGECAGELADEQAGSVMRPSMTSGCR